MTADVETNTAEPETQDGYVEQSFDFKPIEYHEWRQEGNMLRCSSCPHQHGAPIKQGMVLSKNQEGNFILTKEY